MQFFAVILVALLSVQQGYSLTAADRVEILNAHNHVRSLVSPTATNMRRMVYSQILEDIAQGYADKCKFEHSDDDERAAQAKPYFDDVGENVYISLGVQINYTKVIVDKLAFEEAAYYDYDTNSCQDADGCGHYTQIVWAETTHVGCGHTVCSYEQLPLYEGYSSDLIFCNYGPGGNALGQLPYISGTSCSECPTDFPVCSEKLCSP